MCFCLIQVHWFPFNCSSLVTHAVCVLRRMALILNLMCLGEKQKWAYEWHTYRFYTAICKLSLPFSLFSSLSGISIILLFSLFTAIFLWSLALYSYHGLSPFIVAGCQLLEASRLTPVYLASSYRAHVHSHQESFKVAFSIVIAINCCCKVQGSKTGNNKWTLRLLCYFSQW